MAKIITTIELRSRFWLMSALWRTCVARLIETHIQSGIGIQRTNYGIAKSLAHDPLKQYTRRGEWMQHFPSNIGGNVNRGRYQKRGEKYLIKQWMRQLIFRTGVFSTLSFPTLRCILTVTTSRPLQKLKNKTPMPSMLHVIIFICTVCLTIICFDRNSGLCLSDGSLWFNRSIFDDRNCSLQYSVP